MAVILVKIISGGEGMRIGCVIMAAGSGSRFGGNKLAAPFHGKELARYALEAIPEAVTDRVAVTQHEEIAGLAAEYGVPSVRNLHPEWGISYTIRLGTEFLRDCDGILYLVSDQPLLRRTSVERVIAEFLQRPDHIVAMSHNGRRGNPCLFPREFFPELCALEGDVGGSQVIRRHLERLRLVEAEARELEDVDTRDTLEKLGRKSRGI